MCICNDFTAFHLFNKCLLSTTFHRNCTVCSGRSTHELDLENPGSLREADLSNRDRWWQVIDGGPEPVPWGSEGARSISTGTAPERLRRRKRRNLKNSRWDAVMATWREGVLGGGNGRDAGTEWDRAGLLHQRRPHVGRKKIVLEQRSEQGGGSSWIPSFAGQRGAIGSPWLVNRLLEGVERGLRSVLWR